MELKGLMSFTSSTSISWGLCVARLQLVKSTKPSSQTLGDMIERRKLMSH